MPVYGPARTVPVFDADLILTDTPLKIEVDGRINIPVFVIDPETINDGDLFATNEEGGIFLKLKVNGELKTIQFS